MNLLPNFTILKKHSGIRKYFSNTSWLLGERILRMGVSLFVGIYVVRFLGPEKFGLLSYAMSFVLLFGTIASFGLNEILVRDLLQDKTKIKEFGTPGAMDLIRDGKKDTRPFYGRLNMFIYSPKNSSKSSVKVGALPFCP